MSEADQDRVEKTIDLRAPRSRVWRAIASPEEFGTWFGLGEPLRLEGDFVPGSRIMGVWDVGGREVRELFCTIEHVEPERMLSFRWVPYEIPEGDDPDKHPTTRIEFRLDDIEIGTRLTVVESGFAALPPDKQYKREQNAMGWAIQVQSIAAHVLGAVTAKVEDRIARPAADVFEALVDPAKMARYFISHGSARLAPAAKVEWAWADGDKHEIQVGQFEPNAKLSFGWSKTGIPTKVTIALLPDGDATKIVITEAPFALTEERAALAVRQTQRWTELCCGLRAYLQHGIDLRLASR